MAIFIGQKLLAGSFIPTVDVSQNVIAVTEQLDLNTLIEPGFYVGEASAFLNDPAASLYGEDITSRTLVIVSRATIDNLYCVSQVVIYFGNIYVREVSQTGSYPISLSAVEWNQAAIEDKAVNFASVAISNTTASTSTTTGALTVKGGAGFAGNVYANKVYGAVWNDYAEYREGPDFILPGEVVCEKGNDTLVLCDEDCAAGCYIVSDTFGFAIGQTKKANLPVAVSGRVLVYTAEDRMIYKNAIGRPVCGTKNGRIRLMTSKEAVQFPWKILGTVSSVPEYKTWGEKEIEVNDRIWVKVR